MAMRPCGACLENRWKFAVADGMVTATCQSCEREVSFAARKKPRDPNRPQSSPRIDISDRYIPWDPGPRDPNALPWE